jgi:hypothetical protein
MPLPANRPPAWCFAGAGVDMDFKNHRYWGGFVNYGTSNTLNLRNGSLLTVANNGGNYAAPDINGIYTVFPVYSPRITTGFGLWNEGPNTNYALHSRDLSNVAWTKTSMTATRNQIGADLLPNGASLLTATAANGTCLQAITLASTQVIGSALIRRVTGSGTIEMTIDGGATYTNITSQINSSRFTWVEVAAQTLVNPSIGFRITTSGDAIAVDFSQLENVLAGNVKATTPIITTTASSSRGNELPMFNTTGTGYNDGQRIIDNYQRGRPVSAYIEASGNGVSGCVLKGGGNLGNIRLSGVCDGGVARLGSSTGSVDALSANTGTSGRGNINKIAMRINGFGNAVCLNSGAIAAGNRIVDFVGAADTHMGFGNRGAGDQSINGYIGRFIFFPYELTDAQMIDYTR